MNKCIQIILLLFVCCTHTVVAQNINVSSFKLLENDLTAYINGTMERDQNGEVAALIKVVTTEQGFVFDGGMMGIVKTKQGVGEIWVYVPHGIRRITVQHPQLGVLRDYYFPIPIEKAKAYEMKLITGKVETIVTRFINKQFVIFNVQPVNAIVELNDEPLTVDGNGYAEKGVPLGTYNYRVSCANYYTEAGQVVVSEKGKSEVNVSLRPNFGWITFDGDKENYGAHVYVDNERVGQLPFTTEAMKSGEHRVKVVKSMYKTFEQQVIVSDNEVNHLNVTLIPNFANITLMTDSGSEIWVDGKLKGRGSWTGPMEIGEYVVETKKESHRTASEVVSILSLSSRTIQLSSPTPIYGGVEITSQPSRAMVFIDGNKVGETPLVLNNVLIGKRDLKFVKEGYVEQLKSITITENGPNQINVELFEFPKDIMVDITSNPSNASISIDGEYVGRTPMSLPIKIDYHDISVSKKGYWSSNLYGRYVFSNKFHFDLKKIPKTPKEREYYNAYHRDFNIYYEKFYENYNGSHGHGGLVGCYCSGLNYEMAIHRYNEGLQFKNRIGYGFEIGHNFLITPQLAVQLVPDGHGWKYFGNVYLSCRLQYCIMKYLALCVTPEYAFFGNIADKKYDYSGFYCRVGLVLNLPFDWW